MADEGGEKKVSKVNPYGLPSWDEMSEEQRGWLIHYQRTGEDPGGRLWNSLAPKRFKDDIESMKHLALRALFRGYELPWRAQQWEVMEAMVALFQKIGTFSEPMPFHLDPNWMRRTKREFALMWGHRARQSSLAGTYPHMVVREDDLRAWLQTRLQTPEKHLESAIAEAKSGNLIGGEHKTLYPNFRTPFQFVVEGCEPG